MTPPNSIYSSVELNINACYCQNKSTWRPASGMPTPLACAQTSMIRRQWSLLPHSSTPFMARTFKLSWKPCEAKT